MENSLTIQDVLSHKEHYNLAIPFMETQQINPFYKSTLSTRYVDTNEKSLEIFKIGSRKVGNKWENLYSLSKPFLNKLATDAGIQFGAGTGDVYKIDENTQKASAFGAIRLPDGCVRTSNNFKVIDLATEEKKYRLAYIEKAEKGILDYKAATSAAEKYKGKWIDTGQKNEDGYEVKLYLISEQDREKYIENSLLNAMTQLRADAPQKAATGAMLRVIRDLLGIKGTYTMEELKKPFAIARMAFSPDYNDPIIKQMLLQQAIQSVGNLFGNVQPVVQTISIPQTDIEEEVDIPAEISEERYFQEQQEAHQEAIEKITETPKDVAQESIEEDRTNDFRCDKCDNVIPKKVWDYSIEHYGRPLCYKCQKIVRREEKGGRYND